MSTHVVWDWNGTLFDDIDAVYGAACEIFAARGLPPVTLGAYRAAYTRPISAFYSRLFGRPFDAGDFPGLDEDFHAAYRSRVARCALTRGAADVLALWRRRGGTQSLLSMWRHDELVSLATRLGIAGEFVRIDGSRGPDGGPKASHLAAHLEALGANPSDVLVVGDSVDDADAARDAGVACVLYNSGYHDRAALEAVGVPVVDSLARALPDRPGGGTADHRRGIRR